MSGARLGPSLVLALGLALLVVGGGGAVSAARAGEPPPAPALPDAATPANEGGDERDEAGEDDVDYERSLPLESDAQGWERPGFRFALGYSFELQHGLQGVPPAKVHNLVIRGGARLDGAWSLLATFDYGFMDGALSGIRYAVTLDPTWHPIPHLSLALGFGFGGILGGSNERFDWMRDDPSQGLVAAYTEPNAHVALEACDGTGPTALVRAEWAWVLDDIWSIAVQIEGRGFWVACESEASYDEETFMPILHRQYWPLLGGSLGLVFEWR